MIAGAAGYEAMKCAIIECLYLWLPVYHHPFSLTAYEHHVQTTGEKPSHAKMKELLPGFAAAEADKLVETKGLDWVDARRVREQAVSQAHQVCVRSAVL